MRINHVNVLRSSIHLTSQLPIPAQQPAATWQLGDNSRSRLANRQDLPYLNTNFGSWFFAMALPQKAARDRRTLATKIYVDRLRVFPKGEPFQAAYQNLRQV